ncbi:retrovirus-related pol polyprotein from transposon TNT 1-94 [Tanacetum coccineum]|uniref:Retrovirus-related pol polyprotein from transposon TNT 1-94 n=1 Tax=Tanacetum coccineum TaxID=301880 RepID=A0ABQ5IUR0_9ASTR
MTTLAEFMILSGGENRPPMLDKDLTKKYEELSATEKIQADCDLKATNIILQGLSSDVYSLVNHHRVAKDLWERVQLLMQGTTLTKQERECKLYDAFDKFAHIKAESLHHLPPEWSKFVTDVKLVRDMHTTNFDQLNAYLKQHEIHANEVRIMRERNQDPLALVSPQYGSIRPTQHYSTTYPSTPLAITYPSAPYPNAYSSTVHQDAYPQPRFIPQIEYTVSIVNQQTHLTEFPQIDSGLAVHMFKQGDDPIDVINKMMSFLVTVQPIQGRQSSFASSTSGTKANISGHGGNNSGQQRVVKCFNCQGEGHMVRQCPKPKRKRDATWFRDKVLLVEAQGSGKVLNEEELAFLADLRVAEGPVTQTVITHNAAYQADDLDAYVSDCDDISIAKAVVMANLSCYGLDVLSKLSNQVTNCNKVNNDNLIANESLSAELERYKERFADFEKEINSLKQTLSEQLKEKETLKTTFNVLKHESKEKEAKNIDKEIALEKKVKELDNVKAQQIRPMLYDGTVIAKKTNVISVADSKEILMLEEESRSKMLLKQSDPMVLEKKVNIIPINYAEFNRLSKDFGKHFIPQQELFDKQAFWLQTLHPNTDQSASSPVKIEAPRELHKVRLVNTSLKKLKYHLGQFDTVVKKRTTPDALTEGEWGLTTLKLFF